LAKPAQTGTTNKNTIVVPCIVISALYFSAASRLLLGAPSWRRKRSASVPPRRKNPNVATR
jgi:hypothetical protein